MKILSLSLERKLKSIIPLKLKVFLVNLITSDFVGFVIKLINPKFNFFNGYYDYKYLSNKEAALIFFGIWESAEIRFSKRFVNNDIVIELGSSIGVTLGVLGKKLKNVKFICVEASPLNFRKLKHISKKLPTYNEYNLVNKAVSYSDVKEISFYHSSTNDGKIINQNKNLSKRKNIFNIKTITLSSLLTEFKIKENYTLIADIEGFESDIFYKDELALNNCKLIIIEIENTKFISIDQQIKRILKLGFLMVERYGNVIVFKKKINC